MDLVAAINEPTENMIHQLCGSPADLVQLVEAVRWRPLHVVAIPAEAIVHWRTDEPGSWNVVLEWLTTMGVDITVS